MAAAVVPSRARAARSPPPPGVPTDVSYVRLTLGVDAVHGAPPGNYFVRWTRGPAAKVSAARTLRQSGAFGENLTMYARVKRDGPRLVSADETAHLNSQLSLVRLAPGPPGAPAAEEATVDTDVDIGYLLQTMADAGRKSTRTSVRFPDGTLAELTISSKALGEGTLSSLGADADGEPPGAHDDGMNAELVRMRKALRARSDRIDELSERTDQLTGAIAAVEQRGGVASAAEVRQLTERVRDLEVQKAAAEKERADAQRKVDAHVAHAAKIKATYNQLAGWYNNLRQEYAELQTKAKSQAHTSGPAGGVVRQLSAGSSASNLMAEELEKTKAERDSLKSALEKEKEEKTEEISRNSLVLATKAKALEDLRMQWESANSKIQAAQDDALAQQEASENTRRQLEDTKAELEEAKRATADALAKASADVEQLEADRRRELEELRQTVVADSEIRTAAELEAVQKKHAEELAEIAQQASIKDDELQVAITRLDQLTVNSKAFTEEMDKLKLEKIAGESSLKEQLEIERAELEYLKQSALDDLKEEKENAIALLKEEHEKEITALKEEKDVVAQRELIVTQTKSDEVAELRRENERLRADLEKNTALEAEVAKLKEHLASLETENQKLESENVTLASQKTDLETSMRDLLSAQKNSDSQTEEMRLQIAALQKDVEIKSGETEKSIRLLEDFEAENDEQRLLITRLRAERDAARVELEDAAENSKVDELVREQRRVQEEMVALQTNHKTEVEHLKQERDHSIRELFKVRKALNGELKVIKKERIELLEEVEDSKAAKSELEAQMAEKEEIISSMRQEIEVAKEEARSAQEQVGERELSFSKDRDAAVAQSNERITELQTELTALTKQLQEVRAEALQAEEETKTVKDEAGTRTAELEDTMSTMQAEESARKRQVEELEEKLSVEQKEKEKIMHDLGAEAEKLNELRDQEENAQRNLATELAKSAALAAELTSLKESMESVSSSSSSTEQHLQVAQRELAEVRAQREALVSDVSSLKAAAEAAAARASDAEAKLVRQVDDAEKKALELQNDVQKQKERNAELEAKVSSSELETSRAHAQATAVDEQLEAARKNTARLEKEVEILSAKVEGASASATDAGEEIAKLRKLVEQSAAEKDKTVAELKALNEKLHEAESAIEERGGSVAKLESNLKEKEIALEKLSKEKHGMMSELEDVRYAAETAKTELEEQSISSKSLQENLEAARSELEAARKELADETAMRKTREVDMEASRTQLKEVRAEAAQETERLETELLSKTEEVRELRRSLAEKGNADSSMQEATEEYKANLREKEEDFSKLTLLLEEMTEEAKRSDEDYDQLRDEYKSVKRSLEAEVVEKRRLEEDAKRAVEQNQRLEDELVDMQDRLSSVEGAQRGSQRRDRKSSSSAQSELMAARARAEKFEAQLANLKATNRALSVRMETHETSKEASTDQMVNDLIDARIGLAQSQEEIAMLRNQLKRLELEAQGGGSFERKKSKV